MLRAVKFFEGGIPVPAADYRIAQNFGRVMALFSEGGI